uniref:Uncharacterized protein n=1 Tax=Magallana gigas TaxID=29159 RepID=A0A8W8MP55_MAGGI
MAGVWFRVLPPEPVQNKPFTGNPGPKNMPARNASPLEYFLLFFNLNLIREAAAKAAAAASKESPAASSSKDSARKKRKAAQKSHKLSFDGYIDLLAAKIEEGNKTKGNKDQRRGADGKFGNKNLLDCSWRTWLKSMFTEYPGVLCKCSCNHRPLTSAQALIKHIERNDYINNVVSFGEEDLEFTPPQF